MKVIRKGVAEESFEHRPERLKMQTSEGRVF